MEYKSNLTYPNIIVEKENKEYAKKLLELYSGRNSLITSLNKYTYQYTISNNNSNTFYEIIKVIINHIKLLGNTINQLGLDPIYLYPNNIDNGYKYWNSSYLNFEKENDKIFFNNIKDNEIIINICNKLIDEIDDNNVICILKQIKNDYEIHISLFKNLYNNLKNN